MAWPGTLNAYKDTAPQGYCPLLLVSFTFDNGSVQRFCTSPLNVAEGGYQYGGNDYLARVESQDIGAIQARSAQGIDRITEATIHLYNADMWVWDNLEKYPTGRGFKGAILTLTVVLMSFELDGSYSFSTDAPTPYIGICSAPILENGGQTMMISSTAAHNMARVLLPPVINQSRCPWNFPTTAAERLDAVTNKASKSWECPYCPDQSPTDPVTGGSGQRGNLIGGIAATDCNKTKQRCDQLGMYTKDSSNRQTGTFGGKQWQPVQREWQSKSYVEGKTVTVFNQGSNNVWNKPIPQVYGTQWLKDPPIITSLEDGNSTRCEIEVCMGDIGTSGVQQVVCNGVIVPPRGGDALFRWNFGGNPLGTHTGARIGSPTHDAGWDDGAGVPTGDPHGSVAIVEMVVYRKLAGGGGKPSVQILVNNGPKIWVWSDPSTSTLQYSNNPMWVLADEMMWSNWQVAQLDLARFITESAYSDVSIGYVDLHGVSTSHARYICEFALEKRRNAGEVIQQILNGCNAQMVRDPATGLIGPFIRKTLADQQGSAVSGSNYNTAISSVHADGTSASGYAAYHIDESCIATMTGSDGSVVPKMRGPYCRPSSDTPNRISFPFQDRDNSYQDDSISIVDAADVARAGGYLGAQEIEEQYPVLGVSSFDQGIRIGNVKLAETLRGNEALDTRGTRYLDIELNPGVKIAHLHAAHIIIVSSVRASLNKQMFRVLAIAPTTNFESAKIQLAWHVDAWYTDAFGQSPAQFYSDPNRALNRIPYPWNPNTAQPIAGDSMYAATQKTFDVASYYSTAADSTALATISVQGRYPVNALSPLQPPFVKFQAGYSASGGSIGPGHYYIGLCAIQTGGRPSPMSRIAHVYIPSGTANKLTLTGIVWQGSPADYDVFAGISEFDLCHQADDTHSGLPSSISVSNLTVQSYGPPDQKFDHFLPEVKEEIHSGVFAAQVEIVTATTLKFNGATFATNQFAGRTISLLYSPTGGAVVPVINVKVASNTADTLTIGANSAGVSPPDLTTVLTALDLLTMRAHGTIHSATTIGDANFANFYSGAGLTVDGEIGNVIHILAGTGEGQSRNILSNTIDTCTVETWDEEPDATSVWVIAESTWRNAPYTSSVLTVDLNPADATEVALIQVQNVHRKPWLVRMITCDKNDVESLSAYAPIRDLYQEGSPGTIKDGNYQIPFAATITPDIANGRNQELILTGDVTTFNAPIGMAIGDWIAFKFTQDSTGGWKVTWDAAYRGLDGYDVDPTPDLWSSYIFTMNSAGTLDVGPGVPLIGKTA